MTSLNRFALQYFQSDRSLLPFLPLNESMIVRHPDQLSSLTTTFFSVTLLQISLVAIFVQNTLFVINLGYLVTPQD